MQGTLFNEYRGFPGMVLAYLVVLGAEPDSPIALKAPDGVSAFDYHFRALRHQIAECA